MSFETTPFKTLFKVPQKNGLNKPSRVRGAGLPMVNMGEIFAYRRIADIEMDLVPTTEKELRALLEHGDLLFARQSLVYEGSGKCAIFVGHQKTVFESHLIRVRLDSNVSDPRYFFYLFNSSVGRELMAGIISQGAGASGIKGSDLIELEVPRPPLIIQRQISDFLDSLEIQIELLKQQNTVLESIAQALFKSWFVNFDPVHAKAAGREPEGLSAEIAALFPSEFQESELGLIPRNWSVGKLKDFVELRNTRLTAEDVGTLPYVPIDLIQSKSMTLTQFGESADAKSSLIKFENGDILFGAMRPYFHKVCLAPRTGVTRTTVFTLAPKSDYLREIALLTLFQDSTVEFATANSVGSTIPYAKWASSLAELNCVFPAEPVTKAFHHIISPLFEHSKCNASIAANLERIRDELLPRLISGKIRIEEAEEALESVLPQQEKKVA